MNKEEQLAAKRFHDLANTAYHRGIAAYSDFLTLNEINILHEMKQDISFVTVNLCGGYETAERQIAAFIPHTYADLQLDYPISILKITPLNSKFAEKLSHRDFLGAILNLGIDRSKIGDILIKEVCGYCFVHACMTDFFLRELTRIKHTFVKTEVVSKAEEIKPEFLHMEGSVSSERIDALLALAFSSSRSALSGLVAAEKVFINGKLCFSNSQQLKPGDIVSVRGFGKFIYRGFISNTKKGRLFVALDKYI